MIWYKKVITIFFLFWESKGHYFQYSLLQCNPLSKSTNLFNFLMKSPLDSLLTDPTCQNQLPGNPAILTRDGLNSLYSCRILEKKIATHKTRRVKKRGGNGPGDCGAWCRTRFAWRRRNERPQEHPGRSGVVERLDSPSVSRRLFWAL